MTLSDIAASLGYFVGAFAAGYIASYVLLLIKKFSEQI